MADARLPNDRRLIEDYLPIEAISAEASREKSVRKGHISTLHLWWARRPLVACRAAVYGALVPLSRFRPSNGPEEKWASLTRANAARFVERLCKYPGSPSTFSEAERHVLDAHAERLSAEGSRSVTVDDIVKGRTPRPKILDMFAGGGAIPLEALRLGCDTYALELNPVAHVIELCTLVYPQKYGKADRTARGLTGPRNERGETTWGGLTKEVRHWGNWVLEQVRAEIGDMYPLIPDPAAGGHQAEREAKPAFWHGSNEAELPAGYLSPVAYLWTRTVRCKNPDCGARVPLARQTWLCKKQSKTGGRYIALRRRPNTRSKTVSFQVVSAPTADALGFDPSEGSRGGNVVCPFCQSPADDVYVKAEACSGRLNEQLMAVVCGGPRIRGKIYVGQADLGELALGDASNDRAERLAEHFGISVPDEPLEANPRSFDVQHFGFKYWREVFTARQLAAMTAFAGAVKSAYAKMIDNGYEAERAKATTICLSCVLARLADYCTSFCTWQPEFIAHMFDSPGLPMIMDFAEVNPLADSSGGWPSALDYVVSALESFGQVQRPAQVQRGNALSLPFEDNIFDAVITDPPYYDSRSYSNLSDHFYVWHKRAIGHLLPEHFASQLTPKKTEAIAAAYRHNGDRKKADASYETMMFEAFREACRVLKPGKPMVCVYAHKTTAGWTTLVNALRRSGFAVHESWPVEMERRVRQNAQETAALASSILMVARKREGSLVGSYEDDVRPELEHIVRERVDTLWKMGVAGADLVIAAVGAGLRAFTRYATVEYANGEEVPAERFLAEVEGVVLEHLLEKIFGLVGSGVGAIDGPSRFYVLWRYTYKASKMDAGEAIVFTYGQNVELDGPKGLSTGNRALLEKKKGTYRLRDFSERGHHEKLGLPAEDGSAVPLIDALHRVLWLIEYEPRNVAEFLDEARPDRERLRLVAQALAGTALAGSRTEGAEHFVATTSSEQAALHKLLANWRALIEQRLPVQGTLFERIPAR